MNKKIICFFIIGIILNLCFISIVNAEKSYEKIDEKETKFLTSFKIKFLKTRFLLYKQPSTTPPENGFPILFILHGAVQHAFAWFFPFNPWTKQQNMFLKDAIDEDFFVVAPESRRPFLIGPRSWDCFEEDISKNKDLQFIENIIEWLNTSNLPVDTDNIFAAGFSSGAFMCSRIGYAMGEKFNALAVHSGVNCESIKITIFGPVFDCESSLDLPDNHPPTIIVHGEKDSFVPFECANHFYNELVRFGIEANITTDPEGGHTWLSQFNNEILDFFKSYLLN
jgi:poly(3-hydroxybutyrate) depolymerase